MLSGLQGKTVPVTGAATGIGRAMAVAFAEQGAQVVINHRRREAEAAQTAGAVGAAGGASRAVAADVCDPVQVRAAVGQRVATTCAAMARALQRECFA